MGDSWMHFPAIYQAYDSALAKYGFADYYSLSDGTALISMTAESWWQFPLTKNAMESALTDDRNKPIDVVMVSLGGNDVAFKINSGDSLSVLDDDLYKAKLFMDSIFELIHQKLPNAQIIWQCYDYPNFNDPCINYPWDPYCDLWDSHRNPSPYEINRFLNYISDYSDSVVRAYNKPYIHFFNNLGLMQWQYGQTPALRFPPYASYPPHSVPFPGGRLDCPSPHIAMGLNGIDTYHLGPQSFTVLADFYLRKFISNYLRKDRDTTIYSGGADKDGWVRSDNSTGTGELQLAKNSSTVTKGILSFNTSFIPDNKKIKRASLFIKNKTIERKYPLSMVFPDFIKLDIVNGTFGNENIEASDFSAPASATDIACVAGNLRGNDYALRFDLREDALKYINTTGITQFRIELTDENFIRFYNGDTTELEGPYLDLYYDTTAVTAVIDNRKIEERLQIFPNPASQEITVQLNKDFISKKLKVSIYNVQGALVSTNDYVKAQGNELMIDIHSLAEGAYLVTIEQNQLKESGSFVKITK